MFWVCIFLKIKDCEGGEIILHMDKYSVSAVNSHLVIGMLFQKYMAPLKGMFYTYK
jgi:hypothetical protein